MSFSIFRGEVLDATTHKYAATHVSGGGGYVGSTSSGVLGYTAPVHSTVTHHENKDVWIREFNSGCDRQVTLSDSKFAARPGHVITLLWDELSECFEYMHNESTGQEVRSGAFNPATLRILSSPERYAPLLFIAMLIPVLNFFAGLALAFILLGMTPYKPRFKLGIGVYMLVAVISGLTIFFSSYWLWDGVFGRGALFKPLVICTVSFAVFLGSFRRARSIGLGFVERRVREQDAAIGAAQQSSAPAPAG